MKDKSTLQDLIEDASDLSTVADTSKITIDRFVEHQARQTLEFPYDAQSRAQPVKDGDIVRVFSIVPRFVDTVTLRGNVANPGRYSWKPGMRIRDLIPDPQALLTRRYWRNRAAIVNGRATEYPVRTERLEKNTFELNNGIQPVNPAPPNFQNPNGNSNSVGPAPQALGSSNPSDAAQFAQSAQDAQNNSGGQ